VPPCRLSCTDDTLSKDGVPVNPAATGRSACLRPIHRVLVWQRGRFVAREPHSDGCAARTPGVTAPPDGLYETEVAVPQKYPMPVLLNVLDARSGSPVSAEYSSVQVIQHAGAYGGHCGRVSATAWSGDGFSVYLTRSAFRAGCCCFGWSEAEPFVKGAGAADSGAGVIGSESHYFHGSGDSHELARRVV
jgi:hypothetical protein